MQPEVQQRKVREVQQEVEPEVEPEMQLDIVPEVWPEVVQELWLEILLEVQLEPTPWPLNAYHTIIWILRSATGSNTGSPVRSSTGSPTGSSTRSVTGNSTGSATGSTSRIWVYSGKEFVLCLDPHLGKNKSCGPTWYPWHIQETQNGKMAKSKMPLSLVRNKCVVIGLIFIIT